MSVRVEHFSYMTRPYQTRAKNCYPTRPNRGGWRGSLGSGNRH